MKIHGNSKCLLYWCSKFSSLDKTKIKDWEGHSLGPGDILQISVGFTFVVVFLPFMQGLSLNHRDLWDKITIFAICRGKSQSQFIPVSSLVNIIYPRIVIALRCYLVPCSGWDPIWIHTQSHSCCCNCIATRGNY